MKLMTARALLLLPVAGLALAVAACGIAPDNPVPRCGELVCTIEEGGNLRTAVDATDYEQWLHFDFESAGQVDEDDTGNPWDIAFRRVVIMSNGGVSGDGNVEVAIVDDTSFDEVLLPPADGWVTDIEGNGFIRDPGGTAFNQDPWYDYDLINHTLSPKEGRIYVVRTVEGNFFKLRMDAYYDEDAASAHPSFTWATVAPF
jgi:hypothetical protein